MNKRKFIFFIYFFLVIKNWFLDNYLNKSLNVLQNHYKISEKTNLKIGKKFLTDEEVNFFKKVHCYLLRIIEI